MKKLVRGNILEREVIFSMGAKVIGKADKNEKEKIIYMIANQISQMTNIVSTQEVLDILKKNSIYYIEHRKTFNGIDGVALLNKIFVNFDIYYFLSQSYDYETIKESQVYQTLFHECLHTIQRHFRFFGQDTFIGLLEGATQSETLKICNKKASHKWQGIHYNFESSVYPEGIAIARQLENIYGKDIVEKITYKNDRSIVNLLNKNFGVENTNRLLTILRKASRGNLENYDELLDLQYRLMESYFINRLLYINSLETADLLLKEFDNYMLDIMKSSDMKKYEDLYNNILYKISTMVSDFDTQKYKYNEPKFYPIKTKEDRINDIYYWINNYIDDYVEDNNVDYISNDYKEYFYEQGDNVISILILPDNTCAIIGFLGDIYDEPKTISSWTYINENGLFAFESYR